MRIIFVRHGHPDYKNDCLTEIGHKQAEAAAEKLSTEKPARIYASSCGRAYETAEHIAARFGMNVEECDFMREISRGSKDGGFRKINISYSKNPEISSDRCGFPSPTTV